MRGRRALDPAPPQEDVMFRFTATLGLLLSTLSPAAASAAPKESGVGFGATASLQDPIENLIGVFSGSTYYGGQTSLVLFEPGAFGLPTFDIRTGETVVQVHLLDTIALLAFPGDVETIYLGGNVFHTPWKQNIGGEASQFRAFAGFGGSLDVAFEADAWLIKLGPVAPIGVRFGGKNARLALYTMPGIDLVLQNYGTNVQIVVPTASILASVWF